MRRFGVVLLAVLLAFAGCARQAPVPTSAAPSSATATSVRVGATSDPTVQVLAELYVQALAAKGRPAEIAEVADGVNGQVSRLMADELDVVPAFAWSAAQALQVDSSDPHTLVSDLAAALDGEAAVLQPSKVDRAWRYVAAKPNVSLLDLTKKTKVAAPQRWRNSPDGQPGLAAIYRVKPSVTTVAEADRRLRLVKSGAIGVFDATEPQSVDAGVHPVDDPKSMTTADPQLALLRLGLVEDDTVLDVIQQLHGVLDNAAIIEIRTRAATTGVPAAVTEWLKAHPLR
ncbi:MAG: glycine betaine ABC transporter substrate-binding protein [Micropruina sp.]